METLEFLNRAFRNIDLPPLSDDDMRDIGDALRATRPTPDGEIGELVEQIVSAWAFAHDIDGAARNDLFARLRSAARTPRHIPDLSKLTGRLMRRVDGYPQTGRGSIDATGRGTIEMDPAPQVLVNPDGPEAAAALETQAADIARLREALGRARNGLASILPLGYPHPLIAEIDASLATRTDVR